MRIDIASLFPSMCESFLKESIIGRAISRNLVKIFCHNIRDYSKDKHKRVDDYPYGGGKGMLMTPQPIYDCYLSVCNEIMCKPYVIYMSPKGNLLNQKKSISFLEKENIFIFCGHYEGVDQRIIDEIVDEEISIGDYVLTGGELPALVLTDSIVRLCDGVLSEKECFEKESHYNGILEFPQYTRPREWKGRKVPEVLLSGHYDNIKKWRIQKALECTYNKRPDMFYKYMNKK